MSYGSRNRLGRGFVVLLVVWVPLLASLHSCSRSVEKTADQAATGPYDGSVNSIAWSPDGRYVASIGYDPVVRVWDSQTGEKVVELVGHTRDVSCIDWSPDGNSLATGGDDDTVRLWSFPGGASRQVLEGHRSGVLSIRWSPDGEVLASGGADETVRLWSSRGEALSVYEEKAGMVTRLAWSPDSKTLVSGGYLGSILIWNTSRPDSPARISEGTGPMEHLVSIDLNLEGVLTTLGSKGDIRFWNGPDWDLNRTVSLSSEGSDILCASWSPSLDKRIAIAGRTSVQLIDLDQNEVITKIPESSASALDWSPDGKKLAVGASDSLNVYDAETGEILKDF